jgi:cysteinyl-tRNA synthetase
MQLKLYNTLTRQVETVQANGEGKLGLYACGITAYDYPHIGNLRRYVMDDLLIRTLRYDGYGVKFVQNVTDVGHMTSDADEGEDKLEKGARKHQLTPMETARKFEKYFYAASQEMGNLLPDVITRATEYIEQQLKIAVELEKKGFAYLIPGEGLYFDTSRAENYGELAGLNTAKLRAGARVEMVAGKRNPSDFAVWKLEKPGENRQMAWPSPWGERSFPGWHLECVAMSIDQLGEQFEVHTGGIDHIPVHHTNEIAQAEAYTGKKPFVRTWVHHNFMRVEGDKMSKSLGNTYLLEDVKKRGFSPLALRYLFLTAHYRKELNFTWDSMAAAQKAYERLLANLAGASEKKDPTMMMEEHLEKTTYFRDKILAAINDDLNAPEVVATINEMWKSNLTRGECFDLTTEIDVVLGLDLRRQAALYGQRVDLEVVLEPDGEAERLLTERETARANRDYARADYLRKRIEDMGYQIIDTPDGAKVKKNP